MLFGMNNTRSSLERVAQHLYRHKTNGSYYAIVTVAKKQRTKALRVSENLDPTTDRATANRLLRIWEDELTRLDATKGDMTLDSLVSKFKEARAGKAPKTVATEDSIIARFRKDFGRVPTASESSQWSRWPAASNPPTLPSGSPVSPTRECATRPSTATANSPASFSRWPSMTE